ncbi:MAG TPA: hypothetical protein VHU89_14675 [Acidobacteriaceae bacterium]|jgi:hypothetical protein|nr:hypothetical protein [Acidobacteriaceae bacterium]
MKRKLGICCSFPLLFSIALLAIPRPARAQSAEEIVRKVVGNELWADSHDHTRWMYRDAYQSPDKDLVKMVIETPQGNLSMVTEDHGRPPGAQEHQADLDRIQRMLSDSSFRALQKKNAQHDGQQARQMLTLLPDAFVWTIVNRDADSVTLSFHPNPSFSPGSMSAKVLAAMSGTMVVNEKAMRLKALRGRLDQPVEFAWGLLGHLDAGGTFSIERAEVGDGSWQITGMHVHISGHALFFKTIGDQEDEVTSDYHHVPDDVTLDKAAEMLRNGEIARILGVGNHAGV